MNLKTDVEAYERDTFNGALLNSDNEGLRIYKARRAQQQKNKELVDKVEDLESKFNNLESKLDEIINLLKG